MRPVAVRCLHPGLRLDRRAVVRALRVLDENHAGLATARTGLANEDALSVAFLTDAELARLHARFLSDPSATDVITFPGDPAQGTAGEICVSADAARRRLRGRPAAGAYAAELTLYLVHGWLHLAGHGDRAPAGRRSMRRAERRAMERVRAAGALPRFALRRPPR